jgi:putative membrane protein
MIMFWFDHGMGGWGYLFPGLIWLGFWVLVVVGGVLLFRSLTRSQPDRQPGQPDRRPDPAERVLADRYARGEIDDDEYRRRLDTLRSA